jgi:hypothetical protein
MIVQAWNQEAPSRWNFNVGGIKIARQDRNDALANHPHIDAPAVQEPGITNQQVTAIHSSCTPILAPDRADPNPQSPGAARDEKK